MIGRTEERTVWSYLKSKSNVLQYRRIDCIDAIDIDTLYSGIEYFSFGQLTCGAAGCRQQDYRQQQETGPQSLSSECYH